MQLELGKKCVRSDDFNDDLRVKLGVNLISNTKIVSSFLRRKNQIASLTFAFETLLTSKSDYVMPRPDEKTEVPWSIFFN